MATCLKNVNIYWLLGTGILSWFFFIHTPPLVEHLREFRRPIFLFHLTCAFGLCFACVHNTLLTPSVFDGKAKSFHVWVGRAGMVFGLASFVAGAYLAWCPVQDYGFSIPITIGGVLQLHSQKTGYGAIMQYKELKKRLADLNSESKEADEVRAEQQKALSTHIRSMIGLFFLGCMIPAALRIVLQMPYPLPATLVAIFALQFIGQRYTKVIHSRLNGGVPSEESLLNSVRE